MELYWYIVIPVWGVVAGIMLWIEIFTEPRSVAQRNDSSRNDTVAIEMMTIANIDAAIILDMSI